MPHAIYVIDWKRPRRERWHRKEIESGRVATIDDAGAAEIAQRYSLTEAPIVGDGYQIRVRVWPDLPDVHARLRFDPDTDEPAGIWTHDPNA